MYAFYWLIICCSSVPFVLCFLFSAVIDAMAKIPEGIVEGKLHWVGGFDFCNELKINYTYFNGTIPQPRNFTGQYCRLALSSNVCFSSVIDFL